MNKLIVLLACITLSCQAQHKPVNALPATMPADFKLYYHVDGGMRYYSESLLIGADSCVYDLNDGGKQTHRVFKMDKPALDALYTMLKQNRYDEIDYHTEGKVYDRGGINISVSWDKGGKQINVSDAQMSFVSDRWEKEWSAICNYVASLNAGK